MIDLANPNVGGPQAAAPNPMGRIQPAGAPVPGAGAAPAGAAPGGSPAPGMAGSTGPAPVPTDGAPGSPAPGTGLPAQHPLVQQVGDMIASIQYPEFQQNPASFEAFRALMWDALQGFLAQHGQGSAVPPPQGGAPMGGM